VNRHVRQCSLSYWVQIVPRSLTTRKVPVPVTGASYSPFLFFLFYRFTFLLSGIWGFLFSNSFFQLLVLGRAVFVTDADPVMSSEMPGGLPRVQATHQGSRASG
jgi:hypothetical protein